MSKCEECKYAIWDYYDYFGGAKQYFVYDCEKTDGLTGEQFFKFINSTLDDCPIFKGVEE